MTGRLETVGDRPALRFERRLNHPVARVWRAVTEPDELERWFVAPVDWKPEAGEVFEALGQTGRITELEPPRVIAWVWGDELFRFDLEPAGEGSLSSSLTCSTSAAMTTVSSASGGRSPIATSWTTASRPAGAWR